MRGEMADPTARLKRANQEPAGRVFRATAGVGGWLLRRFTRQDWRSGGLLPATGGVIVVANHVSNFDPLALSHFIIWSGRWPRYLAKHQLWDVPILGRLLTALGQIPVVRDTRDASRSLAAATDALQRGQCIVIYPEGTITTDPQGWPMTGHLGAAMLAGLTGCPVVPIGQWGANEVMGFKKPTFPRLIPPKTMHMIIGETFAPIAGSAPSVAEARARTASYMQVLAELVGTLRGMPPPPGRYDPRNGERVE